MHDIVPDYCRVRKSLEEEELQQRCAVPSLDDKGAAKKRRKTDGKGGAGDRHHGFA